MKKNIKVISFIAISVLLLFLILNYKIGFFKNNSAQAVSARGAGGPVAVNAVIVKSQQLENNLTVTGSLIANEYVELSTEMPGKVTNIYFEEGDRIEKGTCLLTINDADLKARLEKLKLQKKLNEDNEYRQQVLFEKEAISKEEYEVALTELNKAEADIREVEAQLDKTKILAPFNGIVGLRYVSEGAFVNTNTTIASFLSINPIKIDFSIPGRYSHLISENQTIRFTVDNFDKPYEGVIYAIEPQIDTQTRTLKIRAISNNKTNDLFPGKFVNVSLNLETIDEALMVPNISVIPELNTHKVFLLQNGQARAVNVEIGIRTDDNIQITKGLAPGDTVITSGILEIREGSPVRVTSLN